MPTYVSIALYQSPRPPLRQTMAQAQNAPDSVAVPPFNDKEILYLVSTVHSWKSILKEDRAAYLAKVVERFETFGRKANSPTEVDALTQVRIACPFMLFGRDTMLGTVQVVSRTK